MRKGFIIGFWFVAVCIAAVVIAHPYYKQIAKHPIESANKNNYTQQKMNYMKQGHTHIQQINMLHTTNKVKEQLNSTPSVKVIHHPSGMKSHYYDKEVVVDFTSSPNDATLNRIMKDIDGVTKQKLDSVYIFKSSSKSPEQLMEYFRKRQDVSYVEPHYLLMQHEVNDTYYRTYQWNLPAIDTETGWNLTRGSKSIKIAVVDTGADLTHPDLAKRLTTGYNALDPKSPPQDDNGHGTHVAGIIASETNNDRGVAGITWFNPIMPVKVIDAKGVGGSFDLAEGIRWAVDHGANVINLSLGNYHTAAIVKDAVRYAISKNVVVVAAAGNDNSNQTSYPAAYPDVLGVAAIDTNHQRASFSNFGTYVDVAAPGVDIPSTYMNGQYAALSGTSMATPHATALAALIRSLDPKLTVQEVNDIIKQTAKKTGTTSPNAYYGNGIIDNVSALQMVYKRTHPLAKMSDVMNRFFEPAQ